MLIYNKNLKVTQEDFNNKEEEIKEAIRNSNASYDATFNQTKPVDMIMLQGFKGPLQTTYSFQWKYQDESGSHIFAQVNYQIQIVSPEELVSTNEHKYVYY